MARRKTPHKKAPSGGFDPESVRTCTDVFVPDEEMEKFSQLATEEDPTNTIPGLSQAIGEGVILPRRIAFITGKKWQNGRTLKVAFLGGTSANQEFVAKAASRWSLYANITFQFGVTAAQSDIRIAFKPSDGAWSYMGTDNLGIPKTRNTMNLGWLDGGVVLHEFGHALGCIHEHQHPESAIPWNKEAVYAYYGGPPNNWNRATIDSNIFGTYSKESTQYSAYDPKSIMHYYLDPNLLTDPSRATSWNNELSSSDTDYVSKIYPKGTVTPPVSGKLTIMLSVDPAAKTGTVVSVQ